MFWKNHWKSVVWAIVILILCSLPSDQVSKVRLINIPHFDKVVHFVLYLVLALLLISENHKKNKDKHGSIIPMLWILIIVIVYGGMIETFQYFFFTSRSASVLDMVANFLGFLVATITYPAVNRITKGYI